MRFSLLNRRSGAAEQAASPPRLRRAPSPGALRRERRAIVKAREERIRHLGGLTLEMYRRSSFRDELLTEQCREIIALEQRLLELDSMLEAVASARKAPTTCDCGAPVPWGSHFCANCGRPVGGDAVIACKGCGHPLPADASFCASCGRPADSESTDAGEAGPMPAPGTDETIIHASVEHGPDPWER